MHRRQFLLSASALSIFAMKEGFGQNFKATSVPSGVWNRVYIGGGGFATGIDIANDGTKVCRTDSAGAYVFSDSQSIWYPVLTTAGLSDINFNTTSPSEGVNEIRVAPSNSNYMYMLYMGDAWYSTNKGVSWTASKITPAYATASAGGAAAQNNQRMMAYRLAIDPINPLIVYFGWPGKGVYKTTNGGVGAAGAGWTLISSSSIPLDTGTYKSTSPGYIGIAFDPRVSTQSGGVSQTIYVGVFGQGVYQSTDGGATWGVAASSGQPTQVCYGSVAIDGQYYAMNVNASTGSVAFVYSGGAGGTWTNISSGCPAAAATSNATIICDPSDATRVVVINSGGRFCLSQDRGATWGILLNDGTSPARVAVLPEPPWLAWTNEKFMTWGGAVFDNIGNVWGSEGIGCWQIPFTGNPSSVQYFSKNQGIENLTIDQVIIPPNGDPLFAGWDRSVFRSDNQYLYPSTHSPNNVAAIRRAYSIDYSPFNPNFCIYNASVTPFVFTSNNNGITWTGTATDAVNTFGGFVMCSTSTNFMVVTGNLPYVTNDAGNTAWYSPTADAASALFGITTGWTAGCADYNTPNKFYLYNATNRRVYISTDGGLTWTAGSGQTISNGNTQANPDMISVPWQAGHLFLAPGFGTGAPNNQHLQRSTDGGNTWVQVGAASGNGLIVSAACVAAGAKKSGQSYPAIYFSGWLTVSSVQTYGTWRCFDGTFTNWEQVGDLGTSSETSIYQVTAIDADKSLYGKLVAGKRANSYVWRTPD